LFGCRFELPSNLLLDSDVRIRSSLEAVASGLKA